MPSGAATDCKGRSRLTVVNTAQWPQEPVAAVGPSVHDPAMRVVVTTNDPVRLSFLAALLTDAGIETYLLDSHASIVEGSIGAIQRRLAVAVDDYNKACRVLRDANEM
jgi:hypothetical protein